MSYILIYLIIGCLVSFAISEIDKVELPKEERGEGTEPVNNNDRFWFIVLWPWMVYGIVKGYLESRSDE